MMKKLKFYNAKMKLNSNSQFVLYKNFFWKILITYNTIIGLKDNVQQYCSNKLGQTKQISFKHFKLKWKCSFNVLCLFINTVSKTLHAAEWRHVGSYIPNQPHSCFLNHKTDNCPTLTKDTAWLMRAGTSSCASGRHAE